MICKRSKEGCLLASDPGRVQLGQVQPGSRGGQVRVPSGSSDGLGHRLGLGAVGVGFGVG